MSSNEESRKPRRQRDAGPQGTQVFSREEVGRLLEESEAEKGVSGGAEIRGLSAEVSGRSFALKGESIVVGRSADCAIRIDESSVSSEHARLVRDDSGWRVINLLSTNGTFVNDQKISNAPIADGDHIRFGRVEFAFHDPEGRLQSGGASSGWKRWLPWVVVAAVIAVAAVVLLR